MLLPSVPSATPMPEFLKTGVMGQKCCLRVALLDGAQPDSTHELAMRCPACGHRWVWRDPDLPEEEPIQNAQR